LAELLRSFSEHGACLLHDPPGLRCINPAPDQVLYHARFWSAGPQARKDILVQPLLLVGRPADRVTLSRVQ